MRLGYRISGFLGLLSVLGVSLSGFAGDSAAIAGGSSTASFTNLFPDKVVARGKGFTVTQTQVDDALIALKASLAADGRAFPESRRSEFETKVLDRLINVQVLLTKATPEDRAKAKEEGAQRCAEYEKRYSSPEALKRQLLALGMSIEKFRQNMTEECLFRVIIDREIRTKVKIPDEQVKKYYDEHPADFDQPEYVRFAQILFLTEDPASRTPLPEAQNAEKRSLADKVLARLQAGEDFAKLAKEYSDDIAFRNEGGVMPPLKRKDMAPEMEKVAFSIPTNTVSGIINTKVGYHIIRVIERKDARKIPLSEASDRIREFLSVEETQKQLPDYLAKCRAELGVELLNKPTK